MRKILVVFWEYTRQSIKISTQQQVGAVFFIFGKLLRFGMFALFVYYLLSQTKLLAGYTMNQTLIFFLTFHIIDGLAQMLFRQVYRFRPLILSGDLDLVLVKPVHPFVRILVGGVDILDVIPLIVYTGILFWILPLTSGITVVSMVLYGVLILNALVIATAFHIFVLCLGILSTEVDHTIMIYRDITKMGSFPVDIYAQPIRWIITFIIPIGIMITFPVQALFGILSGQLLLISIIFSIVFLGLALISWRYAITRYQSASS
ncbi:MAG: ABC-2 family transporter protein [Patescibacteria group bacterium]